MNAATALVTGGGRGLGRAVARALVAQGTAAAVADIDGPAARETARELTAQGGRALDVELDVTRPDAVNAAVERIERELGVVTLLVNNAGVCPTTPLCEQTPEEWRRTLDVNLNGAFYCLQAVVRRLQHHRRGGRIVNVGSLAGRSGGILVSAAYAASKAGLAGLTKSAARQLAPLGITVNLIAPGPMTTELVAGWDAGLLEQLRAATPLGRLAEAEEIARVVLFLLSDAAAHITGATVDANGGLYIAP